MESAGAVRARDRGDENGSAGGSMNGGERANKRQRSLGGSGGNGGAGGRGAGYSPPEVSYFLSLLEEHLPVTNKEWKAVVRLHNDQFPSLRRTPNSIRRKFASLCRAMSGIDESALSPDVRRAVVAKRRMKNRSDVPDDDDDPPDSDDDEGENEDDSQNGSQRCRESTGENVAMQQAATTGSTPVAAPHYYPTTAIPNGQAPVVASPMPMQMPMQMPMAMGAATVQAQFNNNAVVHAQGMLERLADTSGNERRATATTNGRASNETDLIELIKMQLLQNMEDDRRRRADEKERRDQERRHRDEERAIRDEFRRRYEEERARREEDLRRWEEERDESRRRHDEFMHLILSLVAKKMQSLEDDGRRVLKRQRACADQIHHQLDLLLTEVETAKAQLVEKRDEYMRKRQRSQAAEESASETTTFMTTSTSSEREGESNSDAVNAAGGSPRDAEKGDDESEHIVQEFIERVKMLNLDKAAADELKGLHVALAKYGKQIDKLSTSDITKICRSKEPDHQAVCQLIAEYLYHDGQIAAADALCAEAGIELPSNYRSCFVELFEMTDALKEKNMVPALEWSRRHREELQRFHIDIEFELVRLKYLDVLESCSDVMDAVKLAGEELSPFHATHNNDIGRLMTCAIYKKDFSQSPYKDLFDPNRWDHIREGVVRACCRLNSVPHRAYLDTCLSAGVTALPAMRKLVNVMDSKLANWDSMEELPVEIPVTNEHRFHTVFSCPVSKEESTPSNPPMLLKCGHVICKSCVKKIALNMNRRFKCPTCPMEQSENDTRELFF